jgi:hypothetical protein
MFAFDFYKRVNMRKIVLTTILFVMGLLFSGCGIKTSEYAVSADNVEALRAIEGVKLSVDRFTTQGEEEYHVMCRAAETVTTPGGESFASYISNALKSELKMSGIYDKQSDIELSGEVVDMYASSMLGNAYWEFKVKVKSSNGNEIFVYTKKEYPSAFLAFTACNNMGSSFSGSVRELVSDIIHHKDFEKLITKK